MKIHVGVPELRGRLDRFPFSFVEIQASRMVPKSRVLRTIRSARPELTLALRLVPDLLLASDSENEERIARAAAHATFLVLPTTHKTGPTQENLRRLARFAERFRSETTRVAWEPHGIFEATEEERWASEAGVVLVRDLTRAEAPAGPIGYTRVRALGTSSRPSLHRIDLLAEALTSYEEAFLVIEGKGALRLQRELRGALGSAQAEAEAELDEEDDSDFELDALEELDDGEEDDA